MIFCSRFGGYLYTRGAIYETFSVCVHMSRNVVVSFAEGYSDDLNDKKNRGLYDFLQPIWGAIYDGGYIRGGLYTRVYSTKPFVKGTTVRQRLTQLCSLANSRSAPDECRPLFGTR